MASMLSHQSAPALLNERVSKPRCRCGRETSPALDPYSAQRPWHRLATQLLLSDLLARPMRSCPLLPPLAMPPGHPTRHHLLPSLTEVPLARPMPPRPLLPLPAMTLELTIPRHARPPPPPREIKPMRSTCRVQRRLEIQPTRSTSLERRRLALLPLRPMMMLHTRFPRRHRLPARLSRRIQCLKRRRLPACLSRQWRHRGR